MIEIGFVDTLLHPTYSLTTKGNHEISGFGLQCYLEKGPRDRFPFSYLGESEFRKNNNIMVVVATVMMMIVKAFKF